MKDETGRVKIPGYYDDVTPLGEAEKKRWRNCLTTMRSWKKSWELLSRTAAEKRRIDHGAVAEYSRISQRLCGEQAQKCGAGPRGGVAGCAAGERRGSKENRGRSWSSFGSRDFS